MAVQQVVKSVTVKNLKVCEYMSEETLCFTATVYVDGKRRGTAENRGHGGCTDIHPFELMQELIEYAATLPETQATLSGGKSFEYAQTCESLVDDAVQAALREKDLKRILRNRILFVDVNGDLMQSKTFPPKSVARWVSPEHLAKTTATVGAVKVLNAMPFAEALVEYAKH